MATDTESSHRNVFIERERFQKAAIQAYESKSGTFYQGSHVREHGVSLYPQVDRDTGTVTLRPGRHVPVSEDTGRHICQTSQRPTVTLTPSQTAIELKPSSSSTLETTSSKQGRGARASALLAQPESEPSTARQPTPRDQISVYSDPLHGTMEAGPSLSPMREMYQNRNVRPRSSSGSEWRPSLTLRDSSGQGGAFSRT